jgi:CRISPR-associated exonuclease Cas4
VTTLILALLALGLLFLWLGRRQAARLGLPAGRVVYVDVAGFARPDRPLYDRDLDLLGRPDYLVETPKGVVPVEVKSGPAPSSPYDSHILQLAAYCRLVEVNRGKRPPYGILKYADRAFAVDYTPGLENALLDVIAEMRRGEGSAPDRSHEMPQRCRGCGFRETCDQSLA